MTRLLIATTLLAAGLGSAAFAQSIDTREVTTYTTSTDGPYCREYQKTITVGGKARRAYGTACQQPDGSWQLENGTTVTDVSGYTWTTEEHYTEVRPQPRTHVETVGYWDGPYWRHKRYYYTDTDW